MSSRIAGIIGHVTLPVVFSTKHTITSYVALDIIETTCALVQEDKVIVVVVGVDALAQQLFHFR